MKDLIKRIFGWMKEGNRPKHLKTGCGGYGVGVGEIAVLSVVVEWMI